VLLLFGVLVLWGCFVGWMVLLLYNIALAILVASRRFVRSVSWGCLCLLPH
jgi:hypothetical protein